MGQAEPGEPLSGDVLRDSQRPRIGRLGRVLRFAVMVVIALLTIQSFAVDAFQVVSSSMMPNLVGPNVLFVCPATGQEFRLPAAESPHALRMVVCPFCGAAQEARERQLRAGDKLLVDRATFQFRAPRRFEPVVLRHMANDSKLESVVKRIVGLPGEAVQIVDGDVFVNGQRLRKSLADFKRLTVPLVDFEHLAQAQRAAQSLGDDNPTRQSVWRWPHAATWDARRAAFVIDGGELEFAVNDGGVAGIAAREAINQLFTIRADQASPVNDLLLSIGKLRVFPKNTAEETEPQLRIRLNNNAEAITLVLTPTSGDWVALRGEGELAAGAFPDLLARFRNGLSLDLAIVDGTLQAAMDQELLFRFEIDSRESQLIERDKIVWITANGCRAELGGMRLGRDLSYSAPRGLGPRAGLFEPFQLGPDEYFVLGDNTAISDDSRFWLWAGVSRDQILGRPILVHWPAERSESLGGWIQVPSPDKIRYIR